MKKQEPKAADSSVFGHHQSSSCSCAHEAEGISGATNESRRDFVRKAATLALGTLSSPLLANGLGGDGYHLRDLERFKTPKSRKIERITLLHTADIHGQLLEHDEFFWESGKPVYRRRGGLAVLKTMLHTLRKQNPGNTLLIDGGDCFQGSGVASLSQGKALVPLMNNIGYDVVLPGNWEVVYKKKIMIDDLNGYDAAKICANMHHLGAETNTLVFPPYWIKSLGGIRVGFIGYTDPNIPKRQPPAYSEGLRFTKPLDDVAEYIRMLKEEERCALVFLVTHLGLAQQVDLANQPEVQGTDFILGADTHERIRKPIEGKYARATEPGAFGSFVAKLDFIVEDGVVKDSNYALLDVDPDQYKPDKEMKVLIRKESAPFQDELSKVIGESETPLVRYYVLETPMDNLITDALMWKFKPDIAISNGFRFCPPMIPSAKTGRARITMDFLWSMIPVNSEVRTALVPGKQLWDWLEKELHNVFANNPSERFGGWMVRMQGMRINFTIAKDLGKRLNRVEINKAPIDLNKEYLIASCEREGDPATTLCRMDNVLEPKEMKMDMHSTIVEYLKTHPLVAPKVEGRVTATDAPQTLLSQLEGYGYEFS